VKKLFQFLFFAFLLSPIYSQKLNYREIFGEGWKKAMTFEKDNRHWMASALSKYHISYPLAIAVVFPELVRYSALQDKMEITLLKALYINLGNEYADFSIGQFQMKPSFAEMILEKTSPENYVPSGLGLKGISDFTDIIDFRKSIVSALEDPRSQFNYLIAFMIVCENKFNMKGYDEIYKLRFLATAYNYGIDKSSARIDSMVDKKFFNTKLYKTENYSYADVSIFWYKEFISNE
jgi:hypothetical protein